MPYHAEYHGEDTSDPYWVVDDNDKPVGKHPTRALQNSHIRALYANVPDASKKEATAMYEFTEKASDNPGDYLIVEDRDKPSC